MGEECVVISDKVVSGSEKVTLGQKPDRHLERAVQEEVTHTGASMVAGKAQRRGSEKPSIDLDKGLEWPVPWEGASKSLACPA